MQNKKMVNFTRIEYKLLTVHFDVEKLESTKYTPEIYDELEFDKVDERFIYLHFSRNVFFNEENASGIKILFSLKLMMDDDAIRHFNRNEEKIKKFIEKNKINISDSSRVGTVASLIIAQITASTDGGSLILPPYFITRPN